MAKRAFVLTGGSIKGAFQAGALQYILKKGLAPDHISCLVLNKASDVL